MLRKLRFLLPLFVLPAFMGCPEPTTPNGGKGGPRSDKANQWLKRATEELSALDLEEAKDSIKQAQTAAPGDAEISVLAGRIALARLDFKEAQKSLEGVEGSEAAGLRARAFWYGDDLPHAAEELSHALEDPNFKDNWAKPVRELAGTQGTGRKPFTVRDTSARLVEIRMPRDLGTVLVVPCEIDGQATVAIVDTGVPEVILDTKSRSSPGWVSFKFASSDGSRSIEVRDVPSFVQDLSPFTKGQTVPVGAVLGMNFLRRLHLTFDRLADQIIIRRDEPPAPAAMTRVPTGFFNGGGMLFRATVRKEFEISSALWVNTGTDIPLAFPDPIWKRIGIDTKNLPTTNGQTVGRLTNVRVGPLDVGPADAHAGIPQLEDAIARFKGIDVMGQVGMNFLTGFRVTFAEGGRALWLETDQNTPLVIAPPQGGSPAPKPPPPPAASTAPASSSKPAPSASVAPKPSAKPTPPPAPKPSAAPSTAKK